MATGKPSMDSVDAPNGAEVGADGQDAPQKLPVDRGKNPEPLPERGEETIVDILEPQPVQTVEDKDKKKEKGRKIGFGPYLVRRFPPPPKGECNGRATSAKSSCDNTDVLLQKVWKYSTPLDVFLRIIGLLAAIGAGAVCFPLQLS